MITDNALHVPMSAIHDALRDSGLLSAARGLIPESITGISDDSRQLVAGGCFVAVRGTARDGHAYLPAAADAGVACVICEDATSTSLPALVVTDARAAAAVAAAAFYGNPSRSLRLVGVTGTNGKTTSVGIIRHLLDSPDSTSASIGTLGILVGSAGSAFPGGAGLTTPGAVELQRVLKALVDSGVRSVAMEVSSHALEQKRVLGLEYDAAVFTNLTRDHLDYHETMESYFAAKALLAGSLAPDGAIVANAGDRVWEGLPSAGRRINFGEAAGSAAAVRAESVRFTPRGSEWTLVTPGGEAHVTLPLIGDFNVTNALGAAAAAHALGMSVKDIAERLSSVPQVPGRLEVLSESPTVLRDYAHTPDALVRALAALRPFVPGKLIVVFGCGGDRDRGKRPLMAEAARSGADRLVITSDNPRTEDPEEIIDDIVQALRAGSYDRIEDRRSAIEHAIAMANPSQDVVLLAGKGHETYQIRGTTSFPFDEKVIVRDILASVSGAAPR